MPLSCLARHLRHETKTLQNVSYAKARTSSNGTRCGAYESWNFHYERFTEHSEVELHLARTGLLTTKRLNGTPRRPRRCFPGISHVQLRAKPRRFVSLSKE